MLCWVRQRVWGTWTSWWPHNKTRWLGPVHGQMCKYLTFSPLIKKHVLSFLQPINPLEFAKCSVECAKGPKEKVRGLMGDLAACVIQCVSIQFFFLPPQSSKIFLETEPWWHLRQWPSWSSQALLSDQPCNRCCYWLRWFGGTNTFDNSDKYNSQFG